MIDHVAYLIGGLAAGYMLGMIGRQKPFMIGLAGDAAGPPSIAGAVVRQRLDLTREQVAIARCLVPVDVTAVDVQADRVVALPALPARKT